MDKFREIVDILNKNAFLTINTVILLCVACFSISSAFSSCCKSNAEIYKDYYEYRTQSDKTFWVDRKKYENWNQDE